MTKKGPLGKAEKFYIEGKSSVMTPKEIAKELDRAINLVEDHVNRYLKEMTMATSKFARQSGAVVMTETASQMGDEHRSKIKKKKGRPNCITKIKK